MDKPRLEDAGSINYIEEPGTIPVTTTNNQTEDSNNRESSGKTTEQDPISDVGSLETSRSTNTAIKKDGAVEKTSARGGRRKSTTTETKSASGSLRNQVISTTKQQQQPQQRQPNHSDDAGDGDDDAWSVDSDVVPGAIHEEGTQGHRSSSSVDNLRVGDSSRALEVPVVDEEEEQGEEGRTTTTTMTEETTIHAQLARDPEEIINEARRQWEMGIVSAEAVAVTTTDGSASQDPQGRTGNGTNQKGQHRSRNAKLKIVLAMVIAIVVVVGVVVAVVVGNNDDNEGPTRMNFGTWVDLLDGISDTDVLEDPTTSQYKAVNWLIYDDSEALDPMEEPLSDLIQRYVIAVVFFATGGESLIQNSTVCEWDGVECQDGHAMSIDLRTY